MDKIRTTISINSDVWMNFCINVIKNSGGRKRNTILEELIIKYMEKPKEDVFT